MYFAHKASIQWNIAANYFGQGWTALMGLIFLPVYIQYLGMAAFGLIGFHATLHAWLSFAGNVLGPVANREVARFSADPKENQVIWNRLRSLEWFGTLMLNWNLAHIMAGISANNKILVASKHRTSRNHSTKHYFNRPDYRTSCPRNTLPRSDRRSAEAIVLKRHHCHDGNITLGWCNRRSRMEFTTVSNISLPGKF